MTHTAKEHRQKFEYVARGTSVRHVAVKSHFCADELDAFITLHQCDDVSVNYTFGVGQSEVDEALKGKCVRRLSIVMDWASLAQLEKGSPIESIYMSGVLEQPFDFSAVESLRSLNLNWHSNILGLDRMHWLQDLTLSGFRGESAELSRLNWLQSLALVQPNIASLNFIEQFHRLRKLELAYARRLQDLTGLLSQAGHLEELELDHLPKIRGFEEIVGRLAALKLLRISKCPAMESLEFVRSLRELKFFAFVGMDVISGDITPCRGIPYIGFLDKRHFNCTWDTEKEQLVMKVPKSPTRRHSATR
jgi:hypothetical protein